MNAVERVNGVCPYFEVSILFQRPSFGGVWVGPGGGEGGGGGQQC